MTNSAGRDKTGTVYLVGAGPGDPGLLTRHGAEALAQAEVVVYDRLADHSMLSVAPPDAEMIYVGKQAAVHAVPQEEINRILRDKAREGKLVVRLKGGDPFVFGRGGEEASFLREHRIRFVVVPGVSSAVAAPAYAGIPVTDRRYASSFAVITGHEDPSRPSSRLDWAGIACGADTLVFLMGLAGLPAIAERLIKEGKPAETASAVIERGTTPGQRVIVGTLGDIGERARAANLHPPALVVVGEVVRLRETLTWYEAGPLVGTRILMPRIRRHPSELVRLLREAGGEVTEIPVLLARAYRPAPDLLERIEAADWILFTSPEAIDVLLGQMRELGSDVRGLAGHRLAAIGPATQAHLKRLHLRVDHRCQTWRHAHALSASGAASDRTPDLLAVWPGAPEERLLIVGERGEVEQAVAMLASTEDAVRSPGRDIDVLAVSSCEADIRSPLPSAREFDAVVFASSGTVRAFVEAYAEKPGPRQLVVSMGPSTTAAARSLGIRIDAEAEEARAVTVVRLIVQRLGCEWNPADGHALSRW